MVDLYNCEKQYLDLLSLLVTKASVSPCSNDRTGTGTWSLYGQQIAFATTNHNAQSIVPLLTSKLVSFDFVISELLWFLKGSTNVNDLPTKWRHLWSPWANDDGSLGPTYGVQFRGSVDPFKAVVQGIKSEPHSRRHLFTLWDNATNTDCKLPPCHGTVIQFHVDKNRLHLSTYQRSADIFLGVPYNLASYTVLLHIVSALTCFNAGNVYYTFGDLHLYRNHLEPAKLQLARVKRRWFNGYKTQPAPLFTVAPLELSMFDVADFKVGKEDFGVFDYCPLSAVSAPLAV